MALERKIAQGVFTAPSAAVSPSKTTSSSLPKKRPPALSEDKKLIKQQWHTICTEIEDSVLRGKLSQVSLEFKEESDENIYLVCAYDALQIIIEKNISAIKEKIEQYIHKSISLKVTTKQQYDNWYVSVYGQKDQFSQEDAEFASILGSYFPEAEIQ